ncbi:hypothetical protein D3C85_1813150 [compost metagenome]
MLGRATAFEKVAHHRNDRLAAIEIAHPGVMRHGFGGEYLLQSCPVLLVEHAGVSVQHLLDTRLVEQGCQIQIVHCVSP